jgi:iron complex outermembrane receptor protein
MNWQHRLYRDRRARDAPGYSARGRTRERSVDIASPVNPIAENTFYGGLLEIQYRISDAISVKSLSAYRYSDTHNDSVDGNPLTIPPLVVVYAPEEDNEYTQEFQLNMDIDTNKFVAGLYYLVDRIEGLHFVPLSFAILGGQMSWPRGN